MKQWDINGIHFVHIREQGSLGHGVDRSWLLIDVTLPVEVYPCRDETVIIAIMVVPGSEQ
jgi:uncharacterized protein YxjI